MALNLNYKPNKLVDITTLTEDQWLDWRRKGIGGSDVAVALNSSPYADCKQDQCVKWRCRYHNRRGDRG